ncbi:META domain-containing protein, partial [Actinoplanes cyaneus]|uniref:META domain-containing protein n=2 Tax=Actinoplanes cyaneus TaxID=52696 RepID=UPI001942BCA8
APPPSPSGPSDPIALVGMWTPVGIGAEPASVVGLTPEELTVYQTCGELQAAWKADSQGLFIADVMSSSDGCDPDTRVAWLDKAAGYRVDGRTVVLVDVDGATIAHLVASGKPLRPDRESFEVPAEFRRSFAPPAVLPAGLTPVVRQDLPGRWVPVSDGPKPPNQPYLAFGTDGRWAGSDGCNGSGGGWVSGPAGTLLATTGITTLVGCDNVPVGSWLSSARRAGLDGATLVLLDQNAAELGRLRRDDSDPDITTSPSGE